MSAEQETHKRYLEYRGRHEYFGKTDKVLTLAEYGPLEIELAELEGIGDHRDDDEEERFEIVARLLYRD